MNKPNERNNDAIRLDQVIELACRLSSKELTKHWSQNYSDEALYLDKNETQYTEKAQLIFDSTYDVIEETIISAMQKHPSKNIEEIEKCINDVD